MTTAALDAATTVRRLLEAFLAADVQAFTSYIDEDFEWNSAEHHPFLAPQYRGRQEWLGGAVATVAEVLDGFRFDIQQVLGCGEVAVSQLRYGGTVKKNGRSLDVPAVIVWEVRDGKVIRSQEYSDTWEFINAWNADG
jgi:ketosteroid isomerase-like protein